LPRLDLAADFGPNGRTPDNTLNTRDIAVQVSIPFFDGFRRSARRAEQAATASERAVRARDLRRQIAAEVRAALSGMGSAPRVHNFAAGLGGRDMPLTIYPRLLEAAKAKQATRFAILDVDLSKVAEEDR
jgi:hypothetical protein